MKFRGLAREAVARLGEAGFVALFPNLDHSAGNEDAALTLEEKKRLALEHYAAIDEADAVYFLAPGGYMGTSLKLELGYALAKGKPIYFSEPTGDVGLDCYPAAFIGIESIEKIARVG